jgi:hypothetical protein
MKTVHYMFLLHPPKVGCSCFLIPVDHPNCKNNGSMAHTSKVVAIQETPKGLIFTTENTLYKPYEKGEEEGPGSEETLNDDNPGSLG